MNYCSNCGKSVKGMNFCPNCGFKVNKNSNTANTIDLSQYNYPDKLPDGYKWEEGQYGTNCIVKIGSAADRPTGM